MILITNMRPGSTDHTPLQSNSEWKGKANHGEPRSLAGKVSDCCAAAKQSIGLLWS